jgi:hypothetical protein
MTASCFLQMKCSVKIDVQRLCPPPHCSAISIQPNEVSRPVESRDANGLSKTTFMNIKLGGGYQNWKKRKLTAWMCIELWCL